MSQKYNLKNINLRVEIINEFNELTTEKYITNILCYFLMNIKLFFNCKKKFLFIKSLNIFYTFSNHSFSIAHFQFLGCSDSFIPVPLWEGRF